MTQERIGLVPGPQAWRLLRTDKDGASEAQVRNTLGPALAKMLQEANDSAEPWETIKTLEGYRIGAARPIRVLSVGRQAEPLPEGPTLANRQDGVGNVVPTVAGSKPWFVNLDLWWRANATNIAYPGLRRDWLGRKVYGLNGADWTLDKAVDLPESYEQDDPGDETWGDATIDQWGQRIKATAPWIGAGYATYLALGAAAAAGAYFWWKGKQSDV